MHYPLIHRPTFNAVLDFMDKNPVDGIVLGGDQFDNQNLSHHTKNKPLLRSRAGFLREVNGFDSEVLMPLEVRLKRNAEKIYILGNHDDWTDQFIQENPEFDGIQQYRLLDVERRGWTVIPCGDSFTKGKLTFIHGEQLGGFGNQTPMFHSKKAVEGYCRSVLYGHLHSPQLFTKILPFQDTNKWQAMCCPIIGKTNPEYLRNRPTGWVQGFAIIEFADDGSFNCYLINIIKGQFMYGGKLYTGNK
jgi:predicted phosphodiesterase